MADKMPVEGDLYRVEMPRMTKPIRVRRKPIGPIKWGACGHPVHPVKGCRVCPLVERGDETVQAYNHANTGRRDLFMRRWGSSPKKRRSANSYRPGGESQPTTGGVIEGHDFPGCSREAWEPWRVGDLVFAGVTPREVWDAIARICPERSRTIVWPPPAPQFSTLDELHALVSAYGQSLVTQQANMAQNLIDFDAD